MPDHQLLLFPKCSQCKQIMWAGDVVRQPGGPHVICADPSMQRHKQLLRKADNAAGYEIGYVDDDGAEVWL